jgi:branched-subunit amino acid transport protein
VTLPVSTVVIAVLVMAAVTLTLRVLPFLLPRDHPILRYFSGSTPTLDALGPSLLGGLTAVTLIPDLASTTSLAETVVYGCGILATLAALVKSKNIGVATIAGVIVYAGLRALFG